MICTGTTAFPTQAWSKAGDEGVFTRVLKALFAQDLADQGEELNAFELTKRRWQAMIATMDTEGYNTPKNVDELANLAILKAWEKAVVRNYGTHDTGYHQLLLLYGTIDKKQNYHQFHFLSCHRYLPSFYTDFHHVHQMLMLLQYCLLYTSPSPRDS